MNKIKKLPRRLAWVIFARSERMGRSVNNQKSNENVLQIIPEMRVFYGRLQHSIEPRIIE